MRLSLIGIGETGHEENPRASVDSDSIDTNQPFRGHARSVFTSPWFLGGSETTRRYSPLSTRSMSRGSMKLKTQCLYDFEHGGELRVAVRR